MNLVTEPISEIMFADIFTKQVFVLVSGKAGSGKTTFSIFLKELLVEKGYRAVVKSFAYPIKQVAQVFNWDGIKDEKGRKLLQQLGKVGREYNEDTFAKILVNTVINNLNIPEVIIVDDWRFPNEYEYIAKYGMFSVISARIHKDKLDNSSTDVSETSLDSYVFELDIDNNNTLDNLLNTAKDVAVYIETFRGGKINV